MCIYRYKHHCQLPSSNNLVYDVTLNSCDNIYFHLYNIYLVLYAVTDICLHISYNLLPVASIIKLRMCVCIDSVHMAYLWLRI